MYTVDQSDCPDRSDASRPTTALALRSAGAPTRSRTVRGEKSKLFSMVLVALLALTASACSSSNKFRNAAAVTVAYDAPRSEVIAAYNNAFKTLPRVSYAIQGDSVIVGASTDPGFPADVRVRFLDEAALTVVHSSFQYDIVDRFDHYPMMLERSATASLPDGVATYRPQEVYPRDREHCETPLLPTTGVVVPPEVNGGLRALNNQIFYPPSLKKSGVQGAVFAAFVIDENAKLQCVEILSGLPGGLNDQVVGALRASTFRAGTIDGIPTAMRAELPWSFRTKSE